MADSCETFACSKPGPIWGGSVCDNCKGKKKEHKAAVVAKVDAKKNEVKPKDLFQERSAPKKKVFSFVPSPLKTFTPCMHGPALLFSLPMISP